MTREEAISEWLNIHCPKCANNDDRGTDFLNCQAECEVQKDIGIACIHYEEARDIKPQEGEKMKFTPGKTIFAGPVNLALDAVIDLIDDHTEDEE